MPLEAVLLDMGGVLLDMKGSDGLPRGPLDFRGRQVVLRLAGGRRRPSTEDLDRIVFGPWRERYGERYRLGREAEIGPHFEALRAETGCTASADELLAGWFGPYADSLGPLPGARDALGRLRRLGLPVALISNVPLPGPLYRGVLERHGLAELITSFRFSYESGHRKPSPFMLREALGELGVAPGDAVMVGDRKASDVAAGRAAGTGTVWIESEYADGPEPDWTVTSIAAVPALLEGLTRRETDADPGPNDR